MCVYAQAKEHRSARPRRPQSPCGDAQSSKLRMTGRVSVRRSTFETRIAEGMDERSPRMDCQEGLPGSGSIGYPSSTAPNWAFTQVQHGAARLPAMPCRLIPFLVKTRAADQTGASPIGLSTPAVAIQGKALHLSTRCQPTGDLARQPLRPGSGPYMNTAFTSRDCLTCLGKPVLADSAPNHAPAAPALLPHHRDESRPIGRTNLNLRRKCRSRSHRCCGRSSSSRRRGRPPGPSLQSKGPVRRGRAGH